MCVYILRIVAIIMTRLFFWCAACLVYGNPIKDAQREEVSFIEDTIKSMQKNKEAVLKSNADLDKLVRDDAAKLADIATHVQASNAHALATIEKPFSFLQTRQFGIGPQSLIQTLRNRAADSEKRYQDAMKKLEQDKQNLIKDENMRRARAAQERRHL